MVVWSGRPDDAPRTGHTIAAVQAWANAKTPRDSRKALGHLGDIIIEKNASMHTVRTVPVFQDSGGSVTGESRRTGPLVASEALAAADGVFSRAAPEKTGYSIREIAGPAANDGRTPICIVSRLGASTSSSASSESTIRPPNGSVSEDLSEYSGASDDAKHMSGRSDASADTGDAEDMSCESDSSAGTDDVKDMSRNSDDQCTTATP